VIDAEANPLTGNVLILFQPRQTSEQSLMEALQTLQLEALPPSLQGDGRQPPQLVEEVSAARPGAGAPSDVYIAAAESVPDGQPVSTIVYMTGTGRTVYQALGWVSVGMAVVGAITPGIPTTPFVILAGYFFVRSSPEAHAWLRNSRWFGTILRDWEDHRGIRRSVRNAAAGLIGASMGVTALLGLSAGLTATIIALQIVGLAIVLRLRVIDPAAPAPAALVPTTVQVEGNVG
jgi:uncharacterized membrane protein YbaN (DUF454 family)